MVSPADVIDLESFILMVSRASAQLQLTFQFLGPIRETITISHTVSWMENIVDHSTNVS